MKPEVIRRGGEAKTINPAYEAKFGKEPFKITVENNNAMQAHVTNFLSSIRSRQQPTLHVDIAARAQCVITMAVQSYRQGKVLYFDEKNWKIVDKAPKAS